MARAGARPKTTSPPPATTTTPRRVQFKEGALDELRRSARAWERYLKLEPKKPDATVGVAHGAGLRNPAPVRRGGVDALESFEQAARAQEIVAEARPSPIAYFNLAAIQYQIGRIAKGDRAADEAISLTPKDQRNTVRAQLDEARKDGLKIKRETKKAEEQAAEGGEGSAQVGPGPVRAAPGSQVLPNQ